MKIVKITYMDGDVEFLQLTDDYDCFYSTINPMEMVVWKGRTKVSSKRNVKYFSLKQVKDEQVTGTSVAMA